jgi:hypothetical protein
MNLLNTLLFAQKSNLAKTAATNSSNYQLWIWGGVALLVVGLAFAAFKTLAWYRKRMRSHSPQGLWQELCQVHQLDKPQVLALQQLADLREMTPRALIFVQPELWQLDAARNRLGNQVEILRKIERKLFR